MPSPCLTCAPGPPTSGGGCSAQLQCPSSSPGHPLTPAQGGDLERQGAGPSTAPPQLLLILPGVPSHCTGAARAPAGQPASYTAWGQTLEKSSRSQTCDWLPLLDTEQGGGMDVRLLLLQKQNPNPNLYGKHDELQWASLDGTSAAAQLGHL